MKIRLKIVIVVLPLVVAPLVLMGLASIFTARNGVTSVATEFMRFKSEEISKYALSQWTLLQENSLTGRPEFVELSKAAVESFARSMIRTDAELIFAVDSSGAVAMKTAEVVPTPEETRMLASLASRRVEGWTELTVGGIKRVGMATTAASFNWCILVTSTRDSFYAAANQIFLQSLFILVVFAALAVVLLVFFSGYLTRPLRAVVGAMRRIVVSDDLSERVDLLYRDETGDLGHTFNVMTGELQSAYEKIKGHALETAIAQRRERKIRSIFQKYVPAEVIDMIFHNPEHMLASENPILPILFSDIRGFTTITERMQADEMVASLNDYFGRMVDVITERHGIVDKFIGDSIMAFFGAPVPHSDDTYQSVLAALDMLDALELFNADQVERGRPAFHTGTGINRGRVTLGNIGSEKKMDYTVIGDMVNVASRLEGLTKVYNEPIIISESVRRSVEKTLPCRMLDKVAVKGKTQWVRIYSVRRQLSPAEQEGWGLHALGIDLYYSREFEKAASCFERVSKYLPDDEISAVFARRCQGHLKKPPAPDWEGVEVISEK